MFQTCSVCLPGPHTVESQIACACRTFSVEKLVRTEKDTTELANILTEVKMSGIFLWKEHCKDLLLEFNKNKLGDKELSELEAEKSEIEKKLKYTEREIKEVTKLKKELSSKDYDSERRILLLYQKISYLMWDLDSPANEIKGFVTKKELKSFCLDTEVHSLYFIVNNLWKLLDNDDNE